MNETILAVTERIISRSHDTRKKYLDRIEAAKDSAPHRSMISCGNLAHGFAACPSTDKAKLSENTVANIGIITAYNDMLSAHQPYEDYPKLIRETARNAGAVAQVASGVPAMCDGITQGQSGMELSLFSRDVIAMAAAIGLSHNMFDSAMYLGICDKIVPGLLIAALSFGHIPAVFVPAGPMPSGLPNSEKAKTRQLFAEGKVGRKELLEAESKSYHSPGTCTFYGTANSNQMLVEIMGLHLPGASFVNPNTPLRKELTIEATKRALAITALGNEYTPIGKVIDEKTIVNAVVGLLATGGSTNHTMHLIAIANTAGIQLTWDDISELSDQIPLLARVYPNGLADINHFTAAGGMGFLIYELLNAGYLHQDVQTIWGTGLDGYTQDVALDPEGKVQWRDAVRASADLNVLAPVSKPFQESGGLKVLKGNLGRSVIKVSAVAEERQVIEAPARVFHSQEQLQQAFKNKELEEDFIAVVRFQGPKACGMPELHKLTPGLGVLQDKGHKVALVTDGRMSGASGKVPAAIHVTPEAAEGGPIAKIQNGDMIRLDAIRGELAVLVPEEEWEIRQNNSTDLSDHSIGIGRELFKVMRNSVNSAELGAHIFN